MHIDGVGGFFVGILVLWLVVFTAAAAAVHVNRGRYPDRVTRECPHCRERIRRDATICRYCHSSIAPLTLHQGYWWSTDDDGHDIWLDERTGEWQRHTPKP